METEKSSKSLTARQLAEKARNWMATPEGIRCIQEADNRAVEATKELERVRFVSPACGAFIPRFFEHSREF